MPGGVTKSLAETEEGEGDPAPEKGEWEGKHGGCEGREASRDNGKEMEAENVR